MTTQNAVAPQGSTNIPAAPAHLQGSADSEMAKAAQTGSTSYPILRVGKGNFRVKRGNEEKQLKVFDLPVVILGVAGTQSRVFYQQTDEGGAEVEDGRKPDCYSYDSVNPAPELGGNAVSPKGCAVCRNAEWGSAVTPWGSQAQACSSKRRIAIAALDDLDDILLLSLPAASLNPFTNYARGLKGMGVGPDAVLTTLSFEEMKGARNFPLLKFTWSAYLSPDEYSAVKESQVRNADTIESIVHPKPSAVPREDGTLAGEQTNSQRAIAAQTAPEEGAAAAMGAVQDEEAPEIPDIDTDAPMTENPGDEHVDAAAPGLSNTTFG